MQKQEFLDKLKRKLSGLPQKEVRESLSFYSEIIDDRIEEGFSEEDAVAKIGSVNEVATQILEDIPFAKLAKETFKRKKGWRAWEIVLLALGSPIWLSLFISACAIVISLYAVVWSLVISLWATFVALAASAFGVFLTGGALILFEFPFTGLAMIGASAVCAGLSIFFFFGAKAAAKGSALLPKKLFWKMKRVK